MPHLLLMKLVILLATFVLTLPAVDCVVEWNTTKQEIDGFGVSTAWLGTNLTTAQADAFWSTSSGIGLSLIRMRIAPSGTSKDAEIDAAQKAIARGAKAWSTPWSPAANFKDNNNTKSGGNLKPDSYAAYADTLVNYVNNLKTTKGINLYALSLQNEPDLTTAYESCRFTGPQLRDFLAVLGPKMAAAGLSSTKLMLPESVKCNFALADDSLNDPVTRPYVGLIGQHLYGGGPNDYPLARTYGVKLWETEICEMSGSWDAGIDNGLRTAAKIHRCLATYSYSAFDYWWIWNIADKDNNEGLLRATDHTTTSKRYWIMGNYSRFVRPGYQRIAANDLPVTGVTMSAYKNPVGGSFAIIATNTNSAPTTITVRLSGASSASVIPWVTDATNDLSEKNAVAIASGSFSYLLPGKSVTTFAGSASLPTYSVTYNGNGSTGGTVPVDAVTHLPGARVTVLGNTGTLVKTNASFAGWNTMANGSGTSYNGGATFVMGSANMTLYAKWPTSGLTSQAIGAATAGSYSETGGTITIQGSGADIWNAADSFQFVSQPLTGDGTIMVRVASMQNTNGWAKAGVMVRETTATGSKHAFCCETPGHGVAFLRRITTNGTTSYTAGSRSSAPRWLKLTRQGAVLTGYESADGVTWNTVGSLSLSLTNPVQIGLAVTSHANGTLCTAVFDHLTISPAGNG